MQFRMHYDTYYLHLEPTARDAMDKAYAKFEQTMSDLTGRSAGTLAIIEEWRPCFDLLLTEVSNLFRSAHSSQTNRHVFRLAVRFTREPWRSAVCG